MNVELPDGTMLEDIPEGTTRAQIAERLQKAGRSVPQEWMAPKAQPSTVWERIATGVMDPIHGGAQLLERAMPESVVRAVTDLNNWLVEQGISLAKIPAGGVSEMVKQREQEYAAQRGAAGSTGVDWARMAGNVASPANLALAPVPAAGAGLGARALAGAVGGAAMGVMSPTTAEDFAGEKAKQAALGAAVGGTLPAVAAGVARIVRPNVDPNVAKLAAEGVQMTPGQVLGGWAHRAEDALVSVPILGDVIRGAQRRGVVSFDRAVINKSLAPIGEKLPRELEGHKAIAYAAERVSDAYDSVLARMHGSADDTFLNDIGRIASMGEAGLPSTHARELNTIIDREILGKWTTGGNIAGETVKEIESNLGSLAISKLRSADYSDRQVGGALQELQSALRKMLVRVNPENAAELQKVNSAYAQLLRPQKAAGMAGAMSTEGVFTPAQYLAAVRTLDRSRNAAARGRGKALGQQFGEVAQGVLAPTVSDSGTAMRLLAARILTHPAEAAIGALPGILASVPYSVPGSYLTQKALTARPQQADAVAELIRRLGNYAAPAGIAALK